MTNFLHFQVFIDGKEQGSNIGNGELSQDWGYKASIGYYDFDDRRINGWVDEFIIYDYALDEDQVFALLGKMRCPTGNTTSIEIDAFRFESIMTVNVKRSVSEDDGLGANIKTKIKNHFTSKINSKHKTKEKLGKHKRDIKEIKNDSILNAMKNIKKQLHSRSIKAINSTSYTTIMNRRHAFGWKMLPPQKSLKVKKKKRHLRRKRGKKRHLEPHR